MKALNIGHMGQRISFYRIGETEDEMGQTVNEPVLFATVWADVNAKSGLENMEAGKLIAETRYQIRIRYRDDLSQEMLILWKGRWLEIKSIINTYSRNKVIDLDCVEYVKSRGDGNVEYDNSGT